MNSHQRRKYRRRFARSLTELNRALGGVQEGLERMAVALADMEAVCQRLLVWAEEKKRVEEENNE